MVGNIVRIKIIGDFKFMSRIKKLICLVMALVLVFALSGCNDNKTKREEKQKNKRYAIAYLLFLAPPVGLEPTTLRLTAACSTD